MRATAVALSFVLALSQSWTAKAQVPAQEPGSTPKLNLVIVEGNREVLIGNLRPAVEVSVDHGFVDDELEGSRALVDRLRRVER